MEVGANSFEKFRYDETKPFDFETVIALQALVDKLIADSDARTFIILNKMVDKVRENGET